MLMNNGKKKGRYIFFLFILISHVIKMNECVTAKFHVPRTLDKCMKRKGLSDFSKMHKTRCKNGMFFISPFNERNKREKTKYVLTFMRSKFAIRRLGCREVERVKRAVQENRDDNDRRRHSKKLISRCNASKVVTPHNTNVNDMKDDKEKEEIISSSTELMKHLTFNFDEECNEIMVRLGNFLEVSPHLLFKDVCVNLNKIFTNLYTYDHENNPFASTKHTLNITDDVIKHNKFKIYCVLGLKVLRIFLIKYLRSIKLCIPVEVRKRYVADFLKIDHISKIYDPKYNLINYDIFKQLSDKLKAKLIYFYLALKPQDVPNVLVKIFKAANYKDENELLYKYIYKSKFTSRGGKRFRKNISKEYIQIFEKDKLVRKHQCDSDILWLRFFHLLKIHNPEMADKKKILKQTYRLVFSKMSFANDELLHLFSRNGFLIFDEQRETSKGNNALGGNQVETDEVEVTPVEPNLSDKTSGNKETEDTRTAREKVRIGKNRKNQVINYISNLKKFIYNYIQKNKTIHHNFYVLKKNINMPKNSLYDDIISPHTNLYHFTSMQSKLINCESSGEVSRPMNEHTSQDLPDLRGTTIKEDSNDKETTTKEELSSPQNDIDLYCNTVINNTIDFILDIMMESAGFGNIKTLLGIYSSLGTNKEFKLVHFKHKL
ncbi:hypothetical protein, conserved [Plasmodium gonderi]|uniref:Rhoptry protein n=1 Tax=Plasmodium gonderi TaxID=77519 RepID=A0A1Y1JQ83_PLAGO|nr:hypothetical protein, conserved [Plasmodium gonderi]GAW83635.1 hypothetical protein, conserved [Plasmodium gonderi]